MTDHAQVETHMSTLSMLATLTRSVPCAVLCCAVLCCAVLCYHHCMHDVELNRVLFAAVNRIGRAPANVELMVKSQIVESIARVVTVHEKDVTAVHAAHATAAHSPAHTWLCMFACS
jgi:hypothetical protein